MKTLLLLSLILVSCKQTPSIGVNTPQFDPLNAVGCTSGYAYNFKTTATIEDESCRFLFCADENYTDFEKRKFEEVKKYLDIYGQKDSQNRDRIQNNCQGEKTLGCSHPLATNYSRYVQKEDGSCLFKYCAEKSFAEFKEKNHKQVLEYLLEHGVEDQNGANRIQSVCHAQKKYCSHPEAINYIAGPYPKEGYHKEYCYFKACSDHQYWEHQVYKDYTSFLENTEGEIIAETSSKYCQNKRFHREVSKLKPEVKESDFNKADITLILDNSHSMSEEIDSINEALVNLVPTFKSLKKEIDISVVRFSDIQKEKEVIPDAAYFTKTLNNGNNQFTLGLPLKTGSIKITEDKTETESKSEVKELLDKSTLEGSFSQEQGLCLTLKHLNDLKNKGFKNKVQYVSVILTDEDEHFKDISEKCTQTIESPQPDKDKPYAKFNKQPFLDSIGQASHTQSFLDIFNSLKEKEKMAYGWIGLLYDENNNNCQFENTHGETYLNFARELDFNGVSHQIGDVCADDYTQLLKEKLIDGFLDKIEFKYFLTDSLSVPIIHSVKIISQTSETTLHQGDYEIISEFNSHFIKINERYTQELKNSLDIDVDFTYEK